MRNRHLAGAIALLTLLPSIGATQTAARADTAFSMPIEVSSAGATLRTTLHVAAGNGTRSSVVSIKGFPGNDSQEFPRFMQSKGFNALAMNLRGQMGSEGFYTVGGSPADVSAIVAYLRGDPALQNFRVDPSRVVVVGTSAGSFAALRAAADDPAIRCVALIVPYNWTFAGVSARSAAGRAGLEAAAKRIMQQSPPPVRLPDTFVSTLIDSAEVFDLRQAATRLAGRNVLMVGAKQDSTAPLPAHFAPVLAALRNTGAVVRDTIVDDSHNLPNTLPVVFDLFARWASDCIR